MKFSKYMVAGFMAVMSLSSCVGDLDLKPNDPNTKLEITDKAEWDGFLARLYGNLFRDDVISTSDGGAGTFTRTHFNLNEITADECFVSEKWNDPGYQPLNKNTWSSDNEWIYAAFAREFFNAKMAAEFIHQMQNAGGIAILGEDEAKARIAEARAIRGLSYYQMIDLFGRGPWVDENSITGSIPPTYDRKQLFDAITEELRNSIPDLKPAAQQSYGRISREAGYMLLAKLYLNAEVYTGTPMWNECAAACKEVVKTGIQLAPTYKYLFCATNDRYVGNGEILWAAPQEQGRMETWGGTTYLTAGAWIETVPKDVLTRLNYSGDAWSGLRIRPELSRALKDDPRRMIYEGTFQEDIPDLVAFDVNSCGYMIIKYSNSPEEDYENTAGDNNNAVAMSNTDYPIFRLADTYLMLAECQLRGVDCDGLKYLNMVRARVGLDPVQTITAESLLKERMCELYLEGHRRSDLIRFGRYIGNNYVWSWKNGVYEGASIPEYRALFPIPTQYVATVGQNPGY